MERRDDEHRELMIQAISSLVYEQWERLNRDPYLVPVGISARHVHLSREHVDLREVKVRWRCLPVIADFWELNLL